MNHLFIINPAAGKHDHTQELTPQIRTCCEAAGVSYDIQVSQGPGDVTRLVRQAGESGKPCRIYLCGGDGTLNEAVNGAVGFDNVALGIYPCGTGNDFVRNFSNPAPFRDFHAQLEAQEQRLDLVLCQGQHYALNICSMGLDARIGTQVGKYKKLPLVSGIGAYILSAVVNVIRGTHSHFVLEIDGKTIDDDLTMICIANGRWYGGGFYAVPDARLDDGMLDVLLIQKVSRLTVLKVVGKYKQGRYRELPKLVKHYRCPGLTIHCDGKSEINLDGELLFGKDVTFQSAPKALRFLCPKGLNWEPKNNP